MKSPQFIPDLLNQSPVPMAILLPSGEIIWQNQSSKTLLGKESNLLSIFGESLLQTLFSTKHPFFGTINLEIHESHCNHAVLAIPLGNPDSGEDLRFFAFLPQEMHEQKSSDTEFNIASIAHDLTNPMGAIFGYTDLILDSDNAALLNPQQLDHLYRIRNTASRSIELVKNFQLLSQMSHAALQYEKASTDLNRAVNDVIDYTWRENPNGPHLKIDLSKESIIVQIPRIPLERIISNLLSNAAKYTPQNGNIRIESGRNQEDAFLSVRNNGSPIPSHEIGHIFEKFSRCSAAKEVAGSGLGLFIVKNLVDRARGTIEVSSRVADGTVFVVTLPLA